MNVYALTGCDHAQASSGVLNPGLYNKLRRLFGQVMVANQGESFLADVLPAVSVIRPKLIVRHAGEYYRIQCPFCSDTKKRLWINHYYGQPGPDGRPLIHLAHCFRNDCLSTWEHRALLADRLLGMPNSRERREPSPLASPGEEPAPTVFEPPGDIEPILSLPRGHPAVEYMRFRRYTPEMLAAFEVGYVVRAVSKYRHAANRIYFPIRMNGALVGWQTRYLGDVNWKAANVAKYFSMPGMRRRQILYNYDNARQHPFVVVVEGPTDAHRLGGPAVALLGKSIAMPQRELLVQTWPGKPILFMLDPEAHEEMQGLVFEMANERRTSPVIGITLPEGADPGEWDTEALWNFVYTQAAAQRVVLR